MYGSVTTTNVILFPFSDAKLAISVKSCDDGSVMSNRFDSNVNIDITVHAEIAPIIINNKLFFE